MELAKMGWQKWVGKRRSWQKWVDKKFKTFQQVTVSPVWLYDVCHIEGVAFGRCRKASAAIGAHVYLPRHNFRRLNTFVCAPVDVWYLSNVILIAKKYLRFSS